MQNYPAGAEMERGRGFILYSMHSERPCVFPHKLRVLILQIPSSCWGFAFFLCFYLNGKLISKKTAILQWVLFLIQFAYSYTALKFYSLVSLVSHIGFLNTGYTTALDMCEVCTEAVRSAAISRRATLQLWTCVKYVPKQSIP